MLWNSRTRNEFWDSELYVVDIIYTRISQVIDIDIDASALEGESIILVTSSRGDKEEDGSSANIVLGNSSGLRDKSGRGHELQ